MNLKNDQRRFRVFVEDAYAAEKEPGKTAEQWRYYEIRGKYGYVYAFSPSHLAVVVTSPRIAERVRRELGWPVIQDGDDETAFKIENAQFLDAAQVIQARKRRAGNPASAERLAQFRFKAGNSTSAAKEAE